jgi:hypothetical protein
MVAVKRYQPWGQNNPKKWRNEGDNQYLLGGLTYFSLSILG